MRLLDDDDDKVQDVAAFLTAFTTGREIHPRIAQLMREEGNFEEWIQDGYLCRIRRSPTLGTWCGYVRVPKDHPVYGLNDIDVQVHGGITYSGPEFAVKIEGDIVVGWWWWIGFDCAHYNDYIPGLYGDYFVSGYRTKIYVKDQVRELVLQLRDMKLQVKDIYKDD